jgi:hypothetical protein
MLYSLLQVLVVTVFSSTNRRLHLSPGDAGPIAPVTLFCKCVGQQCKRQTSGHYVCPPRLTGTVYCDFLRNVIPDLLEDVDLQTRILLRVMHDGAPPHFICSSGIFKLRVSGIVGRTKWSNSVASSFCKVSWNL